MAIVPLTAFQDNYIWTIVNELQHTFMCVDPGDADPVLAYARRNQLALNSILITHHHADHTGGINALLEAFPKATVYGPADQRIPQVKVKLRDEDILHLDHYAFRILNIPGHTTSHICFQEPTKGWLFCGDTLFSGGCGRVFDGTIEQLYNSLQVIKNLPDDTQIFCGHEYTRQNLRFAATIEPDNEAITSYAHYLQESPNQCSLPSTILLEKRINPFFRTHLPELHSFAQKQGVDITDPFSIFIKLRAFKDNYKA
jgi:hydroxyacylglutathione hydrolase